MRPGMQQNGAKVGYITLGCKANQYDTGSMEAALLAAGYETAKELSQAAVIIVNSCTVTAESDRKTRQTVHRLLRSYPQAKLIVAGCCAQRDPQAFLQMPGVSAVLGTHGRAQVVQAVQGALRGDAAQSYLKPPPAQYDEQGMAALHRTRGTLKIQDGCDRFCTYCIIPTVRGPLRSRPLESIAQEAALLEAHGIREIVLTGIRLAAYGKEQETGLSLLDAVECVHAAAPHARIRLGSLDPDEITPAFIARAAKVLGLCPHFHLSLQSGSDSVLKRMGRRYCTAQFADVVAGLREALPNCGITADVLTGFVAETEEEHAQTMAFVQKIAFSRIHVFPYSLREGTAAARMQGHLARAVKQRRAQELIALGDTLEQAYVERQLGQTAEAIFEQRQQGGMMGYTENYTRVWTQTAVAPGERIPIRITGNRAHTAIAEVLHPPQGDL